MRKLLAAFLSVLSLSAFANPIDDKCPQFVIWGAPQIAVEGGNQYICRKGYAVNYDYASKTPIFTVEKLDGDKITTVEVVRKNDFRPDPDVPLKYRASLADYDHSGYDRGHMSPAGDFTYAADVMSESFFLSNMTPQVPDNNRGIWRILEEHTRAWAKKYGTVYVITGAIHAKDSKTIGTGVVVPDYYYKIIIDPKESRIIAFAIPNRSKLSPMDLPKYIVDVETIEKNALVDFKMSAELKKHVGDFKNW